MELMLAKHAIFTAHEIKSLLIDRNFDILFISESKLDESFRNQLFQEDGYRLERRDRNEFGGNIVAFVRYDIPIHRRKDLEMAQTESALLEIKIKDSKWAIYVVYRPPSQSNETFPMTCSSALTSVQICLIIIYCLEI